MTIRVNSRYSAHERLLAVVFCVGCLLGSAAFAQDSKAELNSAELAKMLPPAANSIVVVRVGDILKSPRAQQEGWAKDAREEFLSGASTIPHWVDTLVYGSLYQPGMDEPFWTAGVITVPRRVTLRQIARQEKAEIERIADRSAVRALDGGYLLRLNQGTIAFLFPAFRQATARWIRALDAGNLSPISSFLLKAAASNAHIVIAFDMQDLLDPHRTREFIAAMPQFEKSPSMTRSLGALMDDAVGVTFECSIGAKTNATIRVSFSREVKIPSADLKAVFLAIVNRSGVALDELPTAEFRIDGSDMVISTVLSDQSLRHMMSLISSPSLPHNAPHADAPPEPSKANQVDENASRQYFLAVNDAIGDLSRLNRKQSTYERTVKWHETFARKIYDLRSDGVDPELVEFGSTINRNFRALAASLRGLAVDVNAQERSVTWKYDYDPGWGTVSIWGGVGGRGPSWKVDSNLRQVRERQAAAIAKGAKQREAIWQLIGDERIRITRSMESKYGSDFVKPRRSRRRR